MINMETFKVEATFETVAIASEKLKLCRTSIYHALKMRVRSAGGYYWMTKRDYDINNVSRYDGFNVMGGLKHSKATNVFNYKVLQIDPSTFRIIEIFDNIKQACEVGGFCKTSLYKAISKKIKYQKCFWIKQSDYDKNGITEFDRTDYQNYNERISTERITRARFNNSDGMVKNKYGNIVKATTNKNKYGIIIR